MFAWISSEVNESQKWKSQFKESNAFLTLRAAFIVTANSNLAPANHWQKDLILFYF